MISWLVGEQTEAYAHLATDAVAKGLAQVHRPDTIAEDHHGSVHFAAGMRFAGMPAALVVLREQDIGERGDVALLSLVVAPQLRSLGLARELLNWVLKALQQLGRTALSLSYPLDHNCTPAMEKLTKTSEGWIHRPGLQLMQLDRSGATQLVQRLIPLVRHAQRSGRLAIKPWSDLAANTRQSLGAALDAPKWAHPRDDWGQDPLQALDPSISAVLLDGGQPAGWIGAHRVGERLFRVSQWWVKPELQGSGVALLLLHHAVRGALQSTHGYSCGTFGMEADNTRALNLCQRKIAPFACSVNRQRRAWIQLNDNPA
jgi:ribosomal protein S18 acetylase RimI-like enzyme